MSMFERNLMKSLREDDSETVSESCRSSFRTDKLGNRVEVPYQGSYAVGKSGRGKGIRKGNTAKEDATGQVHELAACRIWRAVEIHADMWTRAAQHYHGLWRGGLRYQ